LSGPLILTFFLRGSRLRTCLAWGPSPPPQPQEQFRRQAFLAVFFFFSTPSANVGIVGSSTPLQLSRGIARAPRKSGTGILYFRRPNLSSCPLILPCVSSSLLPYYLVTHSTVSVLYLPFPYPTVALSGLPPPPPPKRWHSMSPERLVLCPTSPFSGGSPSVAPSKIQTHGRRFPSPSFPSLDRHLRFRS